ncbi:RNA polymerase sigma factor [Paenibacillus sp. V4I5]|uniref:RNA polymerase sigma factor n=1 Tax=Paenibacillus sp. V4I5 TaxID=3042306 RepID=UPI0027D82BA7|nr:sigma-70 family RNA polymerase sigma factor [Paenibacillus sp. V4I5]
MNIFTLDELMKQYGQDVWNYAYFLVKNYEMTDDITQDVFLNVYRNITSYRGEATVKTWLLKITRNISYNYLNAAFFRKVTLLDFIERKEIQPSAEHTFLDQEIANGIWKMVLKLPAKFREVLILDAKYELSVMEIAKLLDVSVGTIKSRLFRARAKISAMLEEEIAYERV